MFAFALFSLFGRGPALELAILTLLVVILFGRKLLDIGKGLGNAIVSFKRRDDNEDSDHH